MSEAKFYDEKTRKYVHWDTKSFYYGGICPNCFQPMKEQYKFIPESIFSEHEGYYSKELFAKCPKCKIKYEWDDWVIPEKMQPTLKQIKTVAFIKNRIKPEGRENEGITRHSYFLFIQKYFDEAKRHSFSEREDFEDDYYDAYDYLDFGDFC